MSRCCYGIRIWPEYKKTALNFIKYARETDVEKLMDLFVCSSKFQTRLRSGIDIVPMDKKESLGTWKYECRKKIYIDEKYCPSFFADNKKMLKAFKEGVEGAQYKDFLLVDSYFQGRIYAITLSESIRLTLEDGCQDLDLRINPSWFKYIKASIEDFHRYGREEEERRARGNYTGPLNENKISDIISFIRFIRYQLNIKLYCKLVTIYKVVYFSEFINFKRFKNGYKKNTNQQCGSIKGTG